MKRLTQFACWISLISGLASEMWLYIGGYSSAEDKHAMLERVDPWLFLLLAVSGMARLCVVGLVGVRLVWFRIGDALSYDNCLRYLRGFVRTRTFYFAVGAGGPALSGKYFSDVLTGNMINLVLLSIIFGVVVTLSWRRRDARFSRIEQHP